MASHVQLTWDSLGLKIIVKDRLATLATKPENYSNMLRLIGGLAWIGKIGAVADMEQLCS